MDNGFFFERGKLLFEENEIYDTLFASQRSKSIEHDIFERSKTEPDFDFKKIQNLKKTEEK